MPNIKNISSLRKYADVLQEVEVGNPVYLTKNGNGRYAIVDIDEYDNLKKSAWERFFAEVEIGEKSGNEQGWLTADEVEKRLSMMGKSDV